MGKAVCGFSCLLINIQNTSSRPSPFHPLQAYTSHALKPVNTFANQSTDRFISAAIPPEEDTIPASSPLPSSSPPHIFTSSPTKSDYDHHAYQHDLAASPTSSPEKSENSYHIKYSPAPSNHEHSKIVVSSPGIAAAVNYIHEDILAQAMTTLGDTQNISPNVLDGRMAHDGQTQSPSYSDEVLEPSSSAPMDVPYASSPLKAIATGKAFDDRSESSALVIEYVSSSEVVIGLSNHSTGSVEDESRVNADTSMEGEDVHTDAMPGPCSIIAPMDMDMSSPSSKAISQDVVDPPDNTPFKIQQTSHHSAALSGTKEYSPESDSTTSSKIEKAQSSAHILKRSISPLSDTLAEPEPPSKRQVQCS
jgi:hypothetical protein